MNHPSRTNIYIKNPLCPLWALWQPKKMKKEPNLRRFRISTFEFRISPRPHPRLCETNPIYPPHPAASPHYSPLTAHYSLFWKNEPNSTRPTASRQHPTAKKCRTNPISPPLASRRLPHPRLYETNPICPHGHPAALASPAHYPNAQNQPNPRTAGLPPASPPPIMRNEPNYRTGTAYRTPIMRNEPNLPYPPPSSRPDHTPSFTKRTQFATTATPPTTQIFETNPIYPHDRPAGPQIIRNERNSRIPSVPPPPISAKRTQFTVPLASRRLPHAQLCETSPISRTPPCRPCQPGPRPKCAKQTQFPPPRTEG